MMLGKLRTYAGTSLPQPFSVVAIFVRTAGSLISAWYFFSHSGLYGGCAVNLRLRKKPTPVWPPGLVISFDVDVSQMPVQSGNCAKAFTRAGELGAAIASSE